MKMSIANILTVVHDNSVTRIVVVSDRACEEFLGILRTLGHEVEQGLGDIPVRDRAETERLNALLDDVYNYITEKSGIIIPKPPKL